MKSYPFIAASLFAICLTTQAHEPPQTSATLDSKAAYSQCKIDGSAATRLPFAPYNPIATILASTRFAAPICEPTATARSVSLGNESVVADNRRQAGE